MSNRSGFLIVAMLLCLLPACAPQGSQNEEARPASHLRMIAALDDAVTRASNENFYIGDGWSRSLRGKLDALPADAPLVDRWLLMFQLGEAELNLGREAEAIELMTEAYDMLDRVAGDMPPRQAWVLVFRLGMAHMRMGETENCCKRYTPDSCLLPIRGKGIHVEQGPSRRAIQYFTMVLNGVPANWDLHFAARWLLNVAYMTIDGYPRDVPEAWLIPPRLIASDEPFPRFANIAAGAGLDTLSLSGAALSDDFDGDGYLDLIVTSWEPSAQMLFFHNDADGTFSDRTAEAGLIGIRGGLNGMHADYDNDGDPDVLILRGAWLGAGGRYPNSLLRNDGDGKFTDVSFDAGIAGADYPTQAGAWGDYDNDGDLDLFVGNESTGIGTTSPSQLYRNEGDGTFTEIAAQAGVTNDRFAKSAHWGDYDGDRDPDLYVSNLSGPNRLYRNEGDGTFVDVAPDLGVTEPNWSFPSWFWDFDNDGVLDILSHAYHATIADVAADLLGTPSNVELARLYHGDGRGGIEEVSASHDLTSPTAPMSGNFGDLDNDGFLDIYLGTGYPNLRELMPNVMYRNRGGRSFVDVSVAGGFSHLQKGHGIVFADFDHDGDQDVFAEMGGAFPTDVFTNAFYENPGFGNHWISIKLVGVRSNRSAIGARIRVDVTERGVTRAIYKHVNTGGTFGSNPLRQTIGLGKADRIERLEIYWPTSETTQIFDEVPLDSQILITEGQEALVLRQLGSYRFGGTDAD